MCIYHFMSSGRAEVRPKSAEKCTAWSGGTSGALPAAGRKPVSGSQTKQKKTLGDKEESPFSFFPPTLFLHCREPIFSLFYLFCFPSWVKSVLVMFSHKVNAGTSCWDCGVVGSQPLKVEFCPLTRLKCNPVSDRGVFQPQSYTSSIPEIFKWLLIFVYCGHCIALSIFMMFFYCCLVSLKGVTV